MANASIHFATYLEYAHPGVDFTIEHVTSGLVNHTVRVQLGPSHAGSEGSASAGLGARSVILKYAPPYVAAVGPEAPLSQERQVVEAAVLSLFGADGPLQYFNSAIPTAGVQVPRLLNYDAERFVLELEDLGPLVTLADFLATVPLGEEDATLLEKCEAIGGRVGIFFANLHAPSTLELVRSAASSVGSAQKLLDLSAKKVLNKFPKPSMVVVDAALTQSLHLLRTMQKH